MRKYKTFRLNVLLMMVCIIFTGSCDKDQQALVLDKDFMTVADLLQYCQGECNETYDWEGKSAYVQGYILNFDNDSIKNKYYTDSKLFLQDIRNGMFMEIRIDENKDPIFEKIWLADDKDHFFIQGTAESVIASNDGECTKGVVLSLIHPDNINFK